MYRTPAFPEVMGPADVSDVSSTTSSNKSLNVPKLISKGLKRHILGTARKPVDLVVINGESYKPNASSPLTDDEPTPNQPLY